MPDLKPTDLAMFEESECSTATGRRIRDAVRELIPLMRREALEAEKQGCVTTGVLDSLRTTGLFRISVPIECGGFALGARDLAEILATVARGDGSTAWITMIASGFARVAMTFPRQTVEEIYRRSADWPGPIIAGASLFSEKIQPGRRVEGGYIVQSGGKWAFGSGCKHAAYVCVGIEYESAQGTKRRGMALLEKGQYQILDDWQVMGLCASSSNSVATTQDIFVPNDRLMPLEEFPARLDAIRGQYSGAGYRLNGLGLMLYVALETMAIVLGMAQGTLDCFIEQAKVRKPFNLPYRTLGEMPSVQVTAAKARAMVSSAQTLLYSRADQLDRMAKADASVTQAQESELMMDFAYAGSVCGQAIDLMQLAIGSSTISEKNPIQRFARDARVALTHGSTRLDPLGEINGREMLGQPPLAGFSGAVPGVPDQAGASAAAPR